MDDFCETDSEEVSKKRHELIEYLRSEGRNISIAAGYGWDCANKIIAYYDLVYACPGDPGGWAFLEAAIDEYKKRVKEVKEDA
jgi:hypothetical protein